MFAASYILLVLEFLLFLEISPINSNKPYIEQERQGAISITLQSKLFLNY